MANNKAKKFAGVKPKNPIYKKVSAPSKQVKKHLAQKTKQKVGFGFMFLFCSNKC